MIAYTGQSKKKADAADNNNNNNESLLYRAILQWKLLDSLRCSTTRNHSSYLAPWMTPPPPPHTHRHTYTPVTIVPIQKSHISLTTPQSWHNRYGLLDLKQSINQNAHYPVMVMQSVWSSLPIVKDTTVAVYRYMVRWGWGCVEKKKLAADITQRPPVNK